MIKTEKVDLEALGERLGHRFDQGELLLEALTHPSVKSSKASGKNYQRLEFLGDRVLALVVAEMLMEAFPDESEGLLARRLTELVRAETCADVAAGLDLGSWIILGEGERQSGGRAKTAILGDVCESVIGAIFQDADFAAARGFVRRLWGPRLEAMTEPPRDCKTALQEWAQARGFPTPTYVTLERHGPDHAPEFLMAVEVSGLGRAEGSGRSKRLAEQAAAEAMLAVHAGAKEQHRG